MTRFARAKGSKSSNERTPENPTPWSEMKKQLLEKNKEAETSKERQAAFDEKRSNYRAFLAEKEKKEAENSAWANFPEVSNGIQKLKKSKKVKLERDISQNGKSDASNNRRNSKEKLNDNEQVVKGNLEKSDSNISTSIIKKTKKNKPKGLDKPERESNSIIEKKRNKLENKSQEGKDKKLKLKNNNFVDNTLEQSDASISISVKKSKKRKLKNGDEPTIKKPRIISENLEGTKIDKSVTIKKQKGKKNIKKDNLTEQDLKKIEKKKQKRLKQLEKRKNFKKEHQGNDKKDENPSFNENPEHNENISSQTSDNLNTNNFAPNRKFKPNKEFSNDANKKKKIRDKKEHPRKKPLMPHKMFINGKEIEVAYIEGFPVKKEDAERLKKLRKEMISKGIPRSQIDSALKLERRRAEKAFAREKKKVCFNCRKSGHNLSECPELNKNDIAETAGSGICFKCGSTEHTHYECKVVRGQEFKFAKCFICNEQGHIARQCPDNSRGLYPKGGACNVCGDVTHLKRDCPRYQAQQKKEENSLSIGTINNNNPDYIEEENASKISTVKRTNKVIKFS